MDFIGDLYKSYFGGMVVRKGQLKWVQRKKGEKMKTVKDFEAFSCNGAVSGRE